MRRSRGCWTCGIGKFAAHSDAVTASGGSAAHVSSAAAHAGRIVKLHGETATEFLLLTADQRQQRRPN